MSGDVIEAAKRMAEVGTADDVVRALHDACAELGSQKAWAKRQGISPAYVNDLLQGRREPNDRIAAMLGFERHVIFVSTGEAS